MKNGEHKKKKNLLVSIIWWIFTVALILLSVSASIEFVKAFTSYSISTNIEMFFFIGIILYLAVHFLLYKPVMAHVLAHELTHALVAKLFGAKSDHMHISTQGGAVKVTKTNFLISLAPYFVPLYALIFTGIYHMARQEFQQWLALCVGAALAFHIALTLYSIRAHQPDLSADSNLVFSLAFIYFMNLAFVVLIFSVFSDKVSFWGFFKATAAGSASVAKLCIDKAIEWGNQLSAAKH